MSIYTEIIEEVMRLEEPLTVPVLSLGPAAMKTVTLQPLKPVAVFVSQAAYMELMSEPVGVVLDFQKTYKICNLPVFVARRIDDPAPPRFMVVCERDASLID